MEQPFKIMMLHPVLELKLTTRFTVSITSGLHCGGGDNKVPKTNPEDKLVHRSRLEESIMGIDGLGDGLEGVHLTGDTHEVSGNETHDGKHGSTSVTDFTLTEPWHKRRVSFGKAQLKRFVKRDRWEEEWKQKG